MLFKPFQLKTGLFALLICINASWGQSLHLLSAPQRDLGPVPDDPVVSGKLSGNGRYLTFSSRATNLVANDTDRSFDVFMLDRQTDQIVRVSTDAAGNPLGLGIILDFTAPTNDGRYVSFVSNHNALPDANGTDMLYTKDLMTGLVINESLLGMGQSYDVETFNSKIGLSGDGQYLTFASTHDIVNNPNTLVNVFRKNRNAGTYELVSVKHTGLASDDALIIDTSGSGRYIVFISAADVLPAGSGGNNHLYLRDMDLATTVMLDVQPNGDPSAFNFFQTLSLSASASDVGTAVFCSAQSDLVSNDTNQLSDVFLYTLGSLQRISLDPNGNELTFGNCGGVTDISDNGNRVAYGHQSDQIVANDDNGVFDVYTYDVMTGTNALVSQDSLGDVGNTESNSPSVDAAGDVIVFASKASNLDPPFAPGSHETLYAHLTSSADVNGLITADHGIDHLLDRVRFVHISDDQNWAIYGTAASNSEPDGSDINDTDDVFLLNRGNGQQIPIGHKVSYSGDGADLSANGRYVTFTSAFEQPLGQVSVFGKVVFLYDHQSGVYTQVARGDAPKVNNNGDVVFASSDATLVANDLNNAKDVFYYDHSAGTIERVNLGPAQTEANAPSDAPDIGGEGADTWVVFDSMASNLTPGDSNGAQDVFMLNWPGGTPQLISQASGGQSANGASAFASISGDGRRVAFTSFATNLTAETYPAQNSHQVLLYDRVAAQLTLISKDTAGAAHTGQLPVALTSRLSIDHSGRHVGFISSGDALVDNDTNNRRDLFVHDMQTAYTQRISQHLDGSGFDRSTIQGQVVFDESPVPPVLGVAMCTSGAPFASTADSLHDVAVLYQAAGLDLIFRNGLD